MFCENAKVDPVHPASPFVQSQAAGKGDGARRRLPPAVCGPQSLSDQPETSQEGRAETARLWSGGLAGPLTNAAINFLLINLVNSY